MKKYLLTLISSSLFITGFAQDIVINSANPNPVCTGNDISIDYNCNSFTPTGTLSVELSDAVGSFAAPVVIATVAAAPAGIINADIPVNTLQGSGYRVRITSSAPALTGSDNGTDITVNVTPQPNITSNPGPFCSDGNCITLSATPQGGSFAGVGITGNVFCPSTAGAGTHTLCYTYTDANGCSATTCESVTVIENTITVSVTGTLETTSCGACDASVIAIASGGVPPYTYMWSHGPSTQSIQQLCAGTYNVLVTDQNGCTASSNVTITEGSGTVQIGFNTINSPTACGTCDGSISSFVTGGTPPYSFTVNGAPSNGNFSNLCAGPYIITVMDDNGCSATESISINDPEGPTLVLDSITHINCLENNSVGIIYVHAEGGGGGYTYQLFTSGVLVSNSLPPFTNLLEGDYYVLAIDMNGCTSSLTGTYTITNTSNLYVSTTTTVGNCDNTGTATATAQGLNPPFDFLWNDPLTQTTATAVNLAPGTYTVQVTDAIGCIRTGTAFVDSVCMNVITGRVYLDTNENCIQDIGEAGVANAIVQSMPGGFYASADSLGDYVLLTPHLNNTVSVPYYTQYYAPTCPATGSLDLNFTQLGDTLSANNFGYYADPNIFDLRITGSVSAARPGFAHVVNLHYRNSSLFTQNAVVRLVYDPLLVFTNASGAGVHDAGQHTVEWVITGIPPFSAYQYANAQFTVPVNTPIGTIVTAYMEILPIAGDLNPSNNTLTLTRPVSNSYDPNDKAVDPAGEGNEGNILPTDTLLFYTVRFQNTGNDTAFTVVVKDTLSSYLNPATLVPGSSSHPYTFSMTGEGVMAFRFDNILLPDSNINEPLSHGYFNYHVEMKNDLPLGTEIENTAHIFFDFNEAIVTNTTLNTIAMPIGIAEPRAENLSVFPNPTANSVLVESDILKGQYHLRDITGKTLLQGSVTAPKFTLDISSLSSGIYFISVSDGEKQVAGKVVKE